MFDAIILLLGFAIVIVPGSLLRFKSAKGGSEESRGSAVSNDLREVPS